MTSGRVRARPAAGASDGEVGRSRLVRVESVKAAAPRGWGWLPALFLLAAIGLLLVAAGDTGAREGAGWGEPLFWIGITTIFAPVAVRLARIGPSRRERIGLVVLVALGLYVAKVMHSPLAFTEHDELGHWAAVDAILQTGHLFHSNPVVQAYPAYPGMDIVASAIVHLSGLSIFAAGVIVIAAARLVLALALFYFVEQVVGSSRVAGLAVLLYATNPNFLFFDALFAYESFALPLAILVLLAAARVQASDNRGWKWGMGSLAALLVMGVVVSHHVTAYALVVFLALWSAAALLGSGRRTVKSTRRIVALATLATIGTILWLLLVAGQVTGNELVPVASGVVSGVAHLFQTGSGGKEVFHASSGQAAEAAWAQAFGFASVAFVLAALPFGLHRAWRRRRSSAVMLIFAASFIAYPITLGLRLTESGTETANRSSEFLFLGIGVLIAAVMVQLWLRDSGARGRFQAAVLAAYASVLLIGGVIVGWPPYDRLPGPYLPAAGERSIAPEGVADAYWARRHLPAQSRILADQTDALLLASYGRLDPQGGKIAGLSVAKLFFSRAFGSSARTILEDDKIRYVAIDDRLGDVLPLRGVYIEGDEPHAFAHRHPISEEALTKFDHVPDLGRILDSGHIAIYDAQSLGTGSHRR